MHFHCLLGIKIQLDDLKVFETDEIFHYALFGRKYLNFENQILVLSTLYLNFYTQDEFLYLGKIIQSGSSVEDVNTLETEIISNLPSGYPVKLYFFEIA